MNINTQQSLAEGLISAIESGLLNGSLKINESMAAYTTWRIGGNAECLYQPEDAQDLQKILQILPEHTPIYWVGLGSNLLVRDGGVKGLIIYSNGVLNHLEINCPAQTQTKEEKTRCTITAQAGVACAIFARKAAHSGLTGAEFLAGIPGTIGGALAMNAGAFGGETWNYVTRVQMINSRGEIVWRTADDFNIQYRKAELLDTTKQEWFLAAEFSFEQDEEHLKQSKAEIKRLLLKRAETQPTKQANAGSVFKNPKNDYAARLIESCGLKGQSINDAQISEKHANFIVNKGAAKASDVEALIAQVKDTVFLKYQIDLVTEVKIIGAY